MNRSVPASLSIRAAPKSFSSTSSAAQERQNFANGVHLAHQKQRTSLRTAEPHAEQRSPAFQSRGCAAPHASQTARIA